MATAIAAVHDSNFTPIIYNSEQALRYTVEVAYLSCSDQYAKVEELPAGHGFAVEL